MNATAVPCPATTRRIMPTTTVDSTTTPPLESDVISRRPRNTMNQPMTSPVANGHVVEATPDHVTPWW